MSRVLRFTMPFLLFCVAYLCFLHSTPLDQQQQSSSSLRRTTPPPPTQTNLLVVPTQQAEQESPQESSQDSEDESRDIISHEIEWAEQTMEAFQRKNGKYPLRSSIKTPHVHTSAWMKESSDLLLSTTATTTAST